MLQPTGDSLVIVLVKEEISRFVHHSPEIQLLKEQHDMSYLQEV